MTEKKEESAEKIDIEVLNVLVYAMAKGLDYLGLQGQLLLDKMGEEIVNYLVEKGELKRVDDPFEMMNQVTDYFTRHGFITKVSFELDGDIGTERWKNWKIFDAVMDLASKQCYLLSCPMCMAHTAILREKGYVIKPIGEPIMGPERSVTSKFQIIDLEETVR